MAEIDARFLRGLTIDWTKVAEDSYLRGIPALAGLETLSFTAPVTFLVGENGTGKSTLLEAVAVAFGFNPEGGTRNYRFSTYDDVSELAGALTLSRGVRRPRTGYFFRAESFFNLASKAEEYDRERPGGPSFGGRDLHRQSHGESFLSFFGSFDGPGLYLMDEPEAALSPQRQLALLARMDRLARAGAQIIAASHSPILLGLPGAALLGFDGGRVAPMRWEDTESYRVTEMFVNRREALLRRLLDDDRP